MTDLTARLVAKLREALEFFNDHPNFALRFDRRRTSYKIAAEIDHLLKQVPTARRAPPTDLPEPKPVKDRDRQTYRTIDVEAALCAWEWMFENRDHQLFAEHFDALGSGGMRHCAMQAGLIAEQTYAHMEGQGFEHIGAYDWEFVPHVLRLLDWHKLTDDNQSSGAPYRPDVHRLFVAMVAADRTEHPDPLRRSFQRKAAA